MLGSHALAIYDPEKGSYIMSHSEWLDQDLAGRIQKKSPRTIFKLGFLVLEGTLANCSLFNIPFIILRPDKNIAHFVPKS